MGDGSFAARVRSCSRLSFQRAAVTSGSKLRICSACLPAARLCTPDGSAMDRGRGAWASGSSWAWRAAGWRLAALQELRRDKQRLGARCRGIGRPSARAAAANQRASGGPTRHLPATDLERNLRRDDRTRISLAPAGRSSFSTREASRDLAARAIAAAPPRASSTRQPCAPPPNGSAAAAVDLAHRRAARRDALVTPARAGRVSCSPPVA
ncbi:hypothetical protein B0J12DRAFT_678718 [Macrophomina phaseolina]|uniref:Uncharacterized protein n=1 Tax=Macrophomina phaseolina TaxID=35725 RepID=A0ABQ8FY80_9PEZI|nr:hypothetical protein B0J12DRAFT_678718 [Macrophomina phaseolina]